MITFLYIIMNLAAVIAIAITLVFFVGIAVRSKSLADPEIFKACRRHITACEWLSSLFAFLYWFAASGRPTRECLQQYITLSQGSLCLGSVWILCALASIILSTWLDITRREKEGILIVKKLRGSCFLMGTVFLLVAFVLNLSE